MIYDDVIYGRVEIDEPIVLEIMNSPEMRRLKGVDQAGYFEPYFPGSSHFRFEHSVGVYLLLKKFGAALEEQIAGLIHDISHGVFSHCLDYIFDEGNQKEQNHQDNIFEDFLRNTTIPNILEKYGLNLNYILDDSRHPLKENNLPDICADRIDYSLRDAFHYDNISIEKINNILNHLKVIDNIWMFDNLEIAKEYSNLFLRMNEIYRSGMESAIMFQTVGDLFKYAWKVGYVQRDDFYTTDQKILEKMKQYLDKDEKLSFYRQRMNNIIKCKNNPDDFDAHIFLKSRFVDPFWDNNGKLLRLSDVDNQWKENIKNKYKAKEYFLKFER
ncbi:MAG: HD domain-containing protein [Candidatus Absconditicoccaceae bacterium]